MTRNIALLRGVNVGGHHKLPMKELANVLEANGCSNVCTYIQSGNIVYEGEISADEMASAIDKEFGFRPPVMILSAQQLDQIVKQCPFHRQGEENPKSVHVYFLTQAPDKSVEAELNKTKSSTEEFLLTGKTLYLHSPKGLSASKIAEKADRLLKVDNTARNWNTVCALIALAKDER